MKTVLLASAAALALTVAGASAKPMTPGAHSPAGHFVKRVLTQTPGSKTLYDQTGGDTGTGVVSDDFDSGVYDSYDDQGADDFTVPSGHVWKVKEVDAPGVYFNGYGPADGVTVYFYKNKGGLPGNLKATVTDGTVTDNAGSFTIKFPSAVKLKAGTYWVSVQAQMNFSGGYGEWGWETGSTQNGKPAAWQNPGNGFGTGCTTWGTLQSCLGYGPDLLFALKGKDSAG
jgi:hypothetical protein